MIFAILGAIGSLQNEPNHVVNVRSEVSDVSTLYVFHNVIHHVKVYELPLLVLNLGAMRFSVQGLETLGGTYISDEISDDTSDLLSCQVVVETGKF